MPQIKVDTSQMDKFISQMQKAYTTDVRKELELLLEGIGFEFLRVIQDEIISRQVVDTRRLLNSFQSGDKNSVWLLNEAGLFLEVGTNVEYAKWVNDGHWQSRRFVPGVWKGNGKFQYVRGAKTGMMLTARRVEGRPYWDKAIEKMEKLTPKFLEAKMQSWLDKYFG